MLRFFQVSLKKTPGLWVRKAQKPPVAGCIFSNLPTYPALLQMFLPPPTDHVRCLVAILSPDLLKSLWCAGEVTTAHMNKAWKKGRFSCERRSKSPTLACCLVCFCSLFAIIIISFYDISMVKTIENQVAWVKTIQKTYSNKNRLNRTKAN